MVYVKKCIENAEPRLVSGYKRVMELFVVYLKSQCGKSGDESIYRSAMDELLHYKGIVFEERTFADVLKKAAEKGRLIFMDTYTTWCAPCKIMSEKVFTREDVGDFFNRNFVNVKMNMDKGEGVTLAEKYGIHSYPTLLLLDATGTVIHQSAGALGAEEFVELFRREAERYKSR